MADDTNTAGLKALQEYLKDCDAHAIVPDVGGAWHAAFQAGRASLAASAGSEPVIGWHAFPHYLQHPDGRLLRTASDLLARHGYTGCAEPLRAMSDVLLSANPSPPEGMAWESKPPATRRGNSVMNAASNHLAALKAQRTSLDGFLALGNEVEHAAWLDAQILELESELNALAVPPAAQAEGWKLVPVEPTEEMKTAAVKYANGSAVYKNVSAAVLRIEEGIYGEVYEAMIAAAPPLPASEAKEL